MEAKTSRTILILEDERQLARVINDAFTDRGFESVVVSSVSDGIKKLEQLPLVHVIWLDHYLLGAENGLDFIVQIKNNPAWRAIPVFVVSNAASNSSVRSYMQLGANNYYTKADYDIGQIITDIEYALHERNH